MPANIKINSQHDYITIKMPVANFTVSRSGERASGPMPAEVFNAFLARLAAFDKQGLNRGDAVAKLVEEIPTIWPGYADVCTTVFNVGDKARVAPSSPFAKKYPTVGTVGKVAKKYVYLRFETPGLVGFEKCYLEKV